MEIKGNSTKYFYLPKNSANHYNIKMFRIYVERKPGFQSEDVSKEAATRIFSEPQRDSVVYTELATDPADI